MIELPRRGIRHSVTWAILLDVAALASAKEVTECHGFWIFSPHGRRTDYWILSRVGVTWYTFTQKAPKFRVDWYKGAYFCKIVNFFGHYNRLKRQTLNGRLPPEDSSVFDDSVCVLIVMT